MEKAATVDEYIAIYPEEVQELLNRMRNAIKKAAPKAEEVISYGLPAYKMNGMLVWFGAHKKHIGFYPRVSAMVKFKKELSVYKSAKGSVQFPFDKPLPVGLIGKMVKYRLKENMLRAAAKK